ncbi:putative GTP-binding protein [Friedmanniomyces endolithicus]|uniref:Putative GTP-binding protein n=1 Tax=Friedmanniomyces endolithicus TaxID=329885 RepID=A0A4U0U854_9PEZI|nr:putative GTP-binding protein [Friedmanniomyces endolithicus]
MPRDPLIALVGKPSSGKSTTLNSLTDTTAKVGNFPFTTIEPNHAIGYLHLPCACSRTSLPNNTPPTPSDPTPLHLRCKPNYGACLNGTRSVPIELLDVAGLVPGAHLGKGLGNKFLDDLRHADALIHVVDVSGTTDQEGKATRGYDPSADIAWLRDEIVRWVLGNLMQKWGGLKRRHTAIKATAVETLQGQFSGYGSTSAVVARTLDRLALKQPLQEWDDKTIELVVNAFVDEKFPTVIALNKIDHPDADKNVAKIARAEPAERLVLCSAISEVFLRRLAKQGFVRYSPGSEFVDSREDLIEQGDPDGGGLKEMDEKLRTRIENLKDMVLYRFGSTGVNQVLTRASEVLGLVPVFPVRNIASFGSGDGGGAGERAAVFRDCVLVKKGSTVGDVYRKVMGDAPMAYVETVGGVRVGEDDEVGVGKNDILSFKNILASPSQHSPASEQAMSMLNPGVDVGVGLGITGLPMFRTGPGHRVPEASWPEHRPVSMSSSFVYEGSAFTDRDNSAYSADDSMSSSDDDDAVGSNDWEDDSRGMFMSARQTPEEGVFTLELSESPGSSDDSFTTAPQRPVNPTGSRSSSPFGVLRPAANGVLDYASVPMRRYVGNGLVDPLGRTERVSIFREARMSASEGEDADEDDMVG